jgi:hypothetical protein
MFKMAVSQTFWAPVKAEIQAEDGTRTKIEFRMKYNRLTVPEVSAIADQSKDDPAGDSNVEFLMQISAGWEGVGDADGQVAEFNKENMQWMADHGLGPAIINAFKDALPKARVKN